MTCCGLAVCLCGSQTIDDDQQVAMVLCSTVEIRAEKVGYLVLFGKNLVLMNNVEGISILHIYIYSHKHKN